MSVNWVRLKSKELLNQVKTVYTTGDDVLEYLNSELDKNSVINFIPQNQETEVSIDLNPFIAPLGRFGKVLLKNGRNDVLKDMIKLYWEDLGKSNPKLMFDTVKVEDTTYTLRSKILFNNKTPLSLEELIAKSDVLTREDFDEVVLGGDNTHIEMQFLSTLKGRIEAKPGDYLDAGVFVHLNGSIKVAAGVNRLVCTNGLVDKFYAWKSERYDFIVDNSMFEKAIELSKWFADKANKPVNNIREISVIFSKHLPKGLTARYWKIWAEKIELKELTWFDVINDMTSLVNKTLGGVRQQVLEIPNLIKESEEKHLCPTCSAKV